MRTVTRTTTFIISLIMYKYKNWQIVGRTESLIKITFSMKVFTQKFLSYVQKIINDRLMDMYYELLRRCTLISLINIITKINP